MPCMLICVDWSILGRSEENDYHIFFYHRGLNPFLWGSSASPDTSHEWHGWEVTHNVIKGRPL